MRSPEMQKAMDELNAKPCECVSCGECRGSGHIWVDFRGRYLGNSRCDDLDEIETCGECYGSGIVETCDRCAEMEELDMIEQEENERQSRLA